MKKEKIYLSIAGFTIEMSFTRYEETTRLIDYSISVMKEYYKNFLVEYSGGKIDHHIEIVYKRIFQTLQNKTKIYLSIVNNK